MRFGLSSLLWNRKKMFAKLLILIDNFVTSKTTKIKADSRDQKLL